MARPEFEVPEFVSESDSDQIQERMMGNLPAHMILPCLRPSKYLSLYSSILFAA